MVGDDHRSGHLTIYDKRQLQESTCKLSYLRDTNEIYRVIFNDVSLLVVRVEMANRVQIPELSIKFTLILFFLSMG